MASTLPPRECTVTKPDGKGYGFFLRIEKDEIGHLIRSVEKDSSADKAGMKDGDRVLRVNGAFVDQQEHAEVVGLIKASGNSVTLLVLDEATYENAKKNGEDLSALNKNSNQPAKQAAASPPAKQPAASQPGMQAAASQPSKQPEVNGDKNLVPRPRLCYLDKDGGSYGFSLKTTTGVSGLYMASLAPNGVAVKAGAREGDRIIEVNGKNVEKDTHDQISQKVRDSGTNVMFLLSDKETDEFFRKQKMKITADKATVQLLPSKPKTVHLKKGPEGYGFYLRQEKSKRGHFIMEIDPGSPAEKAKLKDYDRIVAVNGESVEQQEHEDVVEAIWKGGDKTTFLVVDTKTDQLYTLAGISPFLYLQESPGETKSGTKEVPTPVPVPSTVQSTAPAPVPTSAPIPAVSSAAPKHKPKLCRLEKGTAGYGFHLNAIKEVPGQFIKQVVKGGPADVAGVKEEDMLLEVNGVNVEEEAYEDVVTRIRNAGGKLTLLIVSQEAYEYFKAKKIPIKASMADPLPEDTAPPSYNEIVQASKQRSAPEPTLKASPPPAEESRQDNNADHDEDNTSL
ncbi:hypothetical protein FKM82_007998 [Ascaphus truei]